MFGIPSSEKELEKVFAGREPLTKEQFYFSYFAGKGYSQSVVTKVKEIFDQNIEFDLSRLSSSDDFSKELKYIWDFDSMSDVQIVIDLEKKFGISISDEEATQMKTIEEVIRIVSSKVTPCSRTRRCSQLLEPARYLSRPSFLHSLSFQPQPAFGAAELGVRSYHCNFLRIHISSQA